MTDFVRIKDALGFHRSVPADQVPDDARVLKGVKATDAHGAALDPVLAEVDKADIEPEDKPKPPRAAANRAGQNDTPKED